MADPKADMSGSICGPGTWGRMMLPCPVCRVRRRALQAIVFGSYGSAVVCGGCGTYWSDGEATRSGKREAAQHRVFVRREWPHALAPVTYREYVRVHAELGKIAHDGP